MEVYVACKLAPISEIINFAKEYELGIEIKSFTSQNIFKSEYSGMLDLVKDKLKKFNGPRSLHGLIYEIYDLNSRTMIQTLRNDYKNILNIAEELEAKTIIVHSNFFPGLSKWKYKDWLDCQSDLLSNLAKEAMKNDIVIVLENIVDNSSTSILDILTNVNAKNLKTCIDFGHLNLITSHEEIIKWIRDCSDYVYYTHLHNNNGRYDSHGAIDKGTIDYKLVFLELFALKELPKLAIEVDSLEGVKSSLLQMKEFIKMQDSKTTR